MFSVQIVRAEKILDKRPAYSHIAMRADSLIEKIKYSAKDSTRSTRNNSIISLFGEATLSCEKFDLKASEIVFNKNTQKVTAKDFTIFDKQSKKTTTGSFGEFSVSSKN